MLSKLEESRYAEVKERHRGFISEFPLINAVVSKLQKGLVYVDPESNSSFIATKAGFSLLISDESASVNGVLFDDLRQCHDLPNYIHIYSPPASLTAYLGKVVQSVQDSAASPVPAAGYCQGAGL